MKTKSILHKLAAGVIAFTLLYSCTDENLLAPVTSSDSRFFPLNKGHWVEYEVDSIVHLDSDDPFHIDTAIVNHHFYIHEEIDSVFYDGENDLASVVLRYRRTSDTLPWELSNVWTAKLNAHSAEKIEDNVRFVRLSFPVTSQKTWNGNSYNFFPAEEYSYDELYENIQYGSLTFDSTITVVQNDFVSNINRIYKKETYAPDVGMIEKQIDSVNTENTSSGTIILNGFEYRMLITGYNQ